MTYVTDTHPLLWFLDANRRLSAAAKAALSDPAAQIVVPTIVLAEIAYMRAAGRTPIDLATIFAHVRAASNVGFHPLDEEIAALLPPQLDIHDGIIVATALYRRDRLGETVAVVTKDAQITASGLVPTVW